MSDLQSRMNVRAARPRIDVEFIDKWLVPMPGSALDKLATEIKAEVEGTEGRTRKRKPLDENYFDHRVRAVVANLAMEFAAPSVGDGWLGTSFASWNTRSADYSDCPAFGPLWRAFVVRLETMGLIRHRDGDPRRGRQRGNAPCIAATPLLNKRIEGVRQDLRFARHCDEPVLVLASNYRVAGETGYKTEKVRDTFEIPRTVQTLALADRVRRLNRVFAETDIAILKDDGSLCRSFHTNFPLSVRRRFNIKHSEVGAGLLDDYRFDRGGRLVGGFWQNMKKIERHRLRIKGEPVAEVDYRSMNAHIAYALAGLDPPPGDLYMVPGLERYRSDVKMLFNAMLSMDDGRTVKRWPQSMKDAKSPLIAARIGPEKASGMVAAFHSGLAGMFSTGRILEIQHIESETLLRTLDAMEDMGVVGLPIHDAVIVPAKNAEAVGEIMVEAAIAVVGVHIPVSISYPLNTGVSP